MNRRHVLESGHEITFKRMTVENLDEILSLQRKVIAALATESFLQPLTTEEFLFVLNGSGLMIGAYIDGQLIAFRAMLEPELDDEHLGKDAGLPKSEWPLVLYSEITNVDPDYQGNGLQLLLGNIIMEQVDNKQFRYICTTVAPFNIASLKDKFALGLHIVALKVKYGNLLRYILMKDLTQPLEVRYVLEVGLIAMVNTEEQQQYLNEGWIGVGMLRIEEVWYVRFEKH
ncbi:hypothetical protein [Sporosarcina limicola]|uniref:N-acetyltransferase domain-containing protein n=1 Tax=Sporosarcina limicola TaxID=34101 RepID=A0A927R542_9BACL|nr:hypothetical protein [Sporosarcina limicola]MBE1555588.1 hypothetical protein [Sporosarcina limicola]